MLCLPCLNREAKRCVCISPATAQGLIESNRISKIHCVAAYLRETRLQKGLLSSQKNKTGAVTCFQLTFCVQSQLSIGLFDILRCYKRTPIGLKRIKCVCNVLEGGEHYIFILGPRCFCVGLGSALSRCKRPASK